jgi:hypothetical protein
MHTPGNIGMSSSDRTVLGEYLTASEPLHQPCPSSCYVVYGWRARRCVATALSVWMCSDRFLNTRHTYELEQSFFPDSSDCVPSVLKPLHVNSDPVGPRPLTLHSAHGPTSSSAFGKHSAPCAAKITGHTVLANLSRRGIETSCAPRTLTKQGVLPSHS